MHDELLQVVDAETGEPTGDLLPRSKVIGEKLWCRSTNIFVLNSKGDILCHQRSLNKERYPGAWMTHFGGHVTEGESFKINALKELEEEIGLHVNTFQLIPWRTSKKDVSHLWVRDFITIYDGPIENLTLQTSEIQQVQWASPDEIMRSLEKEEYMDGERTWLAGTHDFYADYQCMRAVLTATLDAGIFSTSYHHLHKWQPVQRIAA